ncbi:hypothetical protein HZS_5094 [Henneguya salminicola]|nr:hypothetical protein HZS_5094 [Henneguya salminicola]
MKKIKDIRHYRAKYNTLKVIEYASTGNIKQAFYAEVCGWISDAWTSVTNECVKIGFQKALYETGKRRSLQCGR